MRTLRTPLYPILLQASLFLFPAALCAGTRKIQIQGKLTNAAGVPLAGAQTVTFKLWPALTGGTATWNSGALSVTPSTGGLFNIPLQDGTPSLDTLAFDVPYFLGITVGADAEMAPRQELGASALSHGSPLDFKVKNNLIVGGSVGVGTTTAAGAALYVSSTTSGGANRYGVVGQVTGGTNNYAVYGTTGTGALAAGTGTWAGYFAGKLYAAGNTGIGTTNPVSPLHVMGDATVQNATLPSLLLLSTSTAGSETGWRVRNDVSNGSLNFTYLKSGTATTLVSLSTSGVVNFSGQTAARAYRSANVPNGIASSSPTKVNLSSETYDLQGNFDSATNYRFTAAVTGHYSVIAQVESVDLGQADIKLFVYIYKNGVEYTRSTCVSGAGVAAQISCLASDLIQLNANDYLELYTKTSAAAPKDIQGGQGRTYMVVKKEL